MIDVDGVCVCVCVCVFGFVFVCLFVVSCVRAFVRSFAFFFVRRRRRRPNPWFLLRLAVRATVRAARVPDDR